MSPTCQFLPLCPVKHLILQTVGRPCEGCHIDHPPPPHTQAHAKKKKRQKENKQKTHQLKEAGKISQGTISLRTFSTLNSESKDVLQARDRGRKGEMQKQDDWVTFIVLETKKEGGRIKEKDRRDPEISNWKEKRKGANEKHQIKAVYWVTQASQVVVVVKNPPANAGYAEDEGSIPGLGRSPGEGNGNPLQCSSPGNSMDRGAWRGQLYGVAKSWTRLSTHTYTGWGKPEVQAYSVSTGCVLNVSSSVLP